MPRKNWSRCRNVRLTPRLIQLESRLVPDATPFPLGTGFSFSQDWTNAAQITTDNTWTGVLSLIGYRGSGLVAGTGVDPQTVVADGSATPVNVKANATPAYMLDPTATGLAEFDNLKNPTIGVRANTPADAPNLVLTLNSRGRTN